MTRPLALALALSWILACGAAAVAADGGDAGPAEGAPRRLWYGAPAKKWEREALPIGNGRLGCMIFGDAGR